jgi:hypothetical protein
MEAAQYASLPPTTPAMTLDQSSGWSTIAALAPQRAAPTPAPAPVAAGGLARGGAGQRQIASMPATGGAPAAGLPRGLFAGVESAEVVRRGNNVNPGDYVAKLCSAEFKQGRDANFVIIEVEMLVSSYDANDPAKIQCNPEGSRATIFIKKNDSFASNIKEVVLALSGFNEQGIARDVHDAVTQQECESLVSPDQPFTGAMVYLEARAITTREGRPFTRISWWPCPVRPDGKPDLDRLMREVR